MLDWKDVFPEWKEAAAPQTEQTEEEMIETMKLLAASVGGAEPSI